jgi:hypothetical protein
MNCTGCGGLLGSVHIEVTWAGLDGAPLSRYCGRDCLRRSMNRGRL